MPEPHRTVQTPAHSDLFCVGTTVAVMARFFLLNEPAQVNFADCSDRSSLSFDGDHYQLVNVHIHSVSEHEVSCE